jgi:hypothetical protein
MKKYNFFKTIGVQQELQHSKDTALEPGAAGGGLLLRGLQERLRQTQSLRRTTRNRLQRNRALRSYAQPLVPPEALSLHRLSSGGFQ